MKWLDLPLRRFPGETMGNDVALQAAVAREASRLNVTFTLHGNTADLLIPAAARCLRKNNLWQQTCFEVFLAPSHSRRYWEFNLSPSGHWNVYSFDDYRENMRQEAEFASLPFTVAKQPHSLIVKAALPLGKLVAPEEPVRLGISAVLRHTDGRSTYWALAHCGEKADFHLRDSFIVTLPSQSSSASPL